VLFSDLEEFTQVSEKLEPITLMQWLNSYMERMAELVMEHGGMVDDYYGDAIKANFGVPLKRTREAEFGIDATGAVNCALAMCEEVRRLNVELQGIELPTIRMRIGICTGEVVAGCLGSARRMKYTTIGDTVNIAARLESYGKEPMQNDRDGCICRIMIAESTAQYLDGNIQTEYVGSLPLKGKSERVSVYCVMDKSERCSPVLAEILSG
jgi:adenylate cyclase